MAINWGTEQTATQLTNVGNTWTTLFTATLNALGPMQVQVKPDNESGSVTDALEIRYLASVGTTDDFDDTPIATRYFEPSGVTQEAVTDVIPGVYQKVRCQVRSSGSTDQYTVDADYVLIDPDA